MSLQQSRTKVLKFYGASDREVEELLFYNENVFDRIRGYPASEQAIESTASSAPHIDVWLHYARESERTGVYATLKQRLVQLQFPIQAGMSGTEDYRAATRRGSLMGQSEKKPGLVLQAPDQLKLWIHPTLAGPIPALVAGCRDDFVALVRALTKRNEPHPVPPSMGACIVSGYNNWDRVNRYKRQWAERNPEHNSEADWLVEFKHLIPQKEHYQDQFILLSLGPYSNVSADKLNLTAAEWSNHSLTIRLEHESTHYCTRRFFNSMRNNLLDELIADYMGIVAAIGYYRADWFLRFVGLESFPRYRQGGRLENYRGTPELSDNAFQILQVLVKNAAENLERFDQQLSKVERSNKQKAAIVIALARFTLEELASETGDVSLEEAVEQTLLANPWIIKDLN